jgi:predicted secreted acid phosphatase
MICILIILILIGILTFFTIKEKKMLELMTDQPRVHGLAYYNGWPNEGLYVNHLYKAYEIAATHLYSLNFKNWKKPCIVIDVDDTLVFTDPDRKLGLHHPELRGSVGENPIFLYPSNPWISHIPSIAKQVGVDVIILTARPPTSKLATQINLDELGIPYDDIITALASSRMDFKMAVKKKIAKERDIVLMLGDNLYDVAESGKMTLAIKLPSPDDPWIYIDEPVHN